MSLFGCSIFVFLSIVLSSSLLYLCSLYLMIWRLSTSYIHWYATTGVRLLWNIDSMDYEKKCLFIHSIMLNESCKFIDKKISLVDCTNSQSISIDIIFSLNRCKKNSNHKQKRYVEQIFNFSIFLSYSFFTKITHIDFTRSNV